jgi:HK97 family phage portal protein
LSIFSKIKDILTRDIFNLGLSDPKAWDKSLWNLAGSQSLSGENVTEETALTYSAVFNAISLISGTIGALPLHLMQRKGDKKRMADDRILYRVLHDQWNPYMTAMSGRECLMAHILAWGNGYAEKIRNGYGEVVELWPITPNRVMPEMKDGALVYRIRMPADGDVILPRDKILHVPGLGFDGFIGYSVVAMARKSIGLGMALETFGALYFGQGTHPGVIVSHPGKLGLEGHANLKKSLSETYSSLGNSHRLMLLEEGLKMEKVGIPPNDSQFLESRQFQIPEVARWFNIPPHKLKDLTKSSFSNIEQEQISFVVDSILPWLVRLEQNFNNQLLTKSDKELSGNGRLYFKHIVEGLLRGDSQSRAAFYGPMLDKGVFSINEVRELEDKDPIPGGDEHFVPMNMIPLSMVKEQFKKKLEAAPPVPQLPAPEQIPKKGNGKDKEAQGVPAGGEA